MRSAMSVLAIVLTLAGCERDAPVEGNPYVGTYTLAMVDGEETPVTQQTGTNETTEYLGGSMAIRPDNTYILNLSRRVTQNGVETFPPGDYAGAYDRSGPAFDFRHPDGDFSGDVTGNGDLSLQLDGVLYEFRR